MVLDWIVVDYGFLFWCVWFQGEIFEGWLGGECVMLLKFVIFMNLLGQLVGEVMCYLKFEFGDVIVLYDELDLVLGKVWLKLGGGYVGYNGLCLIYQYIGEVYGCMCIGIGYFGYKDCVVGYVLDDFVKIEVGMLDDLLCGILDGVGVLVVGEDVWFLNVVVMCMLFL